MFNGDWESLQYFASSRETFFSMEILIQADGHVLIGQLSFKQQADLYNYFHKYSGGSVERYTNYIFLL